MAADAAASSGAATGAADIVSTMHSPDHDMVLILDFGSQYSHIIVRRVRGERGTSPSGASHTVRVEGGGRPTRLRSFRLGAAWPVAFLPAPTMVALLFSVQFRAQSLASTASCIPASPPPQS